MTVNRSLSTLNIQAGLNAMALVLVLLRGETFAP